MDQAESEIQSSKAEDHICDMFDNVSEKYDFLNKILSFGIGCVRRKALTKRLKPFNPRYVLDIATGTGDQAIKIAKLNPKSIMAVDISKQMLLLGQKKIKRLKLDDLIKFKHANCSELPFENESFDAVTISFGVRNFNDPLKAIKEVCRVTKNNGVLMVLEFGIPKNPFIRVPFLFHFTKLLPFVGGFLTGNRAAYSYLTNSVKKFPYGKDFLQLLSETGFVDLEFQKCALGISYIYTARKRE